MTVFLLQDLSAQCGKAIVLRQDVFFNVGNKLWILERLREMKIMQKDEKSPDFARGFCCAVTLQHLSVKLCDFLNGGVAGVAGTTGIGIGGLSEELHVLGLYDVLQIRGDAHVH